MDSHSQHDLYVGTYRSKPCAIGGQCIAGTRALPASHRLQQPHWVLQKHTCDEPQRASLHDCNTPSEPSSRLTPDCKAGKEMHAPTADVHAHGWRAMLHVCRVACATRHKRNRRLLNRATARERGKAYLVTDHLCGKAAQWRIDGAWHAQPSQLVQVFERQQDVLHDSLDVNAVPRRWRPPVHPEGPCWLPQPDLVIITMIALHQPNGF